MATKYLARIGNFFKNLFGYPPRRNEKYLENKLNYTKPDIINLYNGFMRSLDRISKSLMGEGIGFEPITSLETPDYSKLFSENIRKEFDIYSIKGGLVLKRKTLESYVN